MLPPSCTIALANGTLNYGTLATHQLNDTESTVVTPWMNGSAVTDTLNINCAAPAQFAVQITDNRLGTADSNVLAETTLGGSASEAFGLSTDPVGTNIGAYTVTATDAGATVDSASGKLIISTDSGNSWTDASSPKFSTTPGWRLSWTRADSSAAPEPVQAVSQTLNIDAAVVGTENLDLANPVSLDGSLTIELVYL